MYFNYVTRPLVQKKLHVLSGAGLAKEDFSNVDITNVKVSNSRMLILRMLK